MTQHTSTSAHVSTWLEHIRVLAEEINPRGSTREGEREGAQYAQAQFQEMGLSPVWESFQSARSIFLPYLIGSGLMLLAFLIYPLGGIAAKVLAALLSILVLVSELESLAQKHPE